MRFGSTKEVFNARRTSVNILSISSTVTLTLVTLSSNIRRPPGFVFVIPGIELCSIRAGTTMKEDVREQTELVIQVYYVQLLTKIHYIGIMMRE